MSNDSPVLTEAEAERLSLISYQLLAAGEALSAPPPINTLAINVMQDVVESTLAAAGDRVRAEVRNRDFDKLFDAVVTSLGSPPELVGLRQAAVALNNARVGFKHHGNLVRDETLRRHYDVAVTLVNELVVDAFHVDLVDVTMLLFVRDEQARGLIRGAETLYGEGDLLGALFRLRLAFDLVVKEYEHRKTVTGWDSIFVTKPSRLPATWDLQKFAGKDGARHIESIVDWIEALDNLTRLGALGIDLQRYAYFDAVAPLANYHGSDHATTPGIRFSEVTGEHYSASYRFVVDTAIRLGANDFTLKPSRFDIDRERHFNPDYVGRPMRVAAAGDAGADHTEESSDEAK